MITAVHLARLCCAIGLIICSIIVLGISADVETILRDHNFSTSTFPYAAFIGGFTFLIESVFIILRFVAAKSIATIFAVDTAWAVLMWILWLAAAGSSSRQVSNCNWALSSRSSLCSKMDAVCAFLWIGFVIWTGVLIFLLVIGVQQSTHGNRDVWREPVPTYSQKAGDHFAAGPGAGAPGFGPSTAPGPGPNFVGPPATQPQPFMQQGAAERV